MARLALLLVVIGACSKRDPATQPTAGSEQPPGRSQEPSAKRTIHPADCSTARACGEALAAAPSGWSNLGRSIASEAAKGDVARCALGLWTLRRDAALVREPGEAPLPAACEVDDEALWATVGSPRPNCDALQRCGEWLTARARFRDHAEMLLEVSRSAVARGWAGEQVCYRTRAASYGQLLNGADVALVDAMPRDCMP